MRNFNPLISLVFALSSFLLPFSVVADNLNNISVVADNLNNSDLKAIVEDMESDSLFNLDIVITSDSCGATTYTASTSIVGGISPFQYQWSTGATDASISGLVAASYSVTVTDSTACSVIDTFTVTSNLLEVRIEESLPATSVNGTDGAASAIASGGQAPYTYEWDNGVTTATNTMLTSGIHSVTVTDNLGCSTSTTFSTVFSALNVVLSGSIDAICNEGTDGSITVTTSDGESPYTYNWSNGDTTRTTEGLSRGTYTVTVTDANGLTGVLDADIEDGDPIFFNIELFPPTCATLSDGRVTIAATGGREPYLYDIGIGLTPVGIIGGIREGLKNYRVISADGCTADTTFTLIAESPGLPNPSFEVVQNGLTASLTNTSTNEPTNFLWEFGEETTTTFPNPGVFEYPDTGRYTLCLTASNFCGSAQTCQVLVFEPGQLPGLSVQIGRDTFNLQGTTISVPVTAGILNNLQSINGTFSLSNPEVANIVSVNNFNLPGLDSTNFTIDAGSFAIDWENTDTTSAMIEEGTVLFNLDVNLTGEPGTCTQIIGSGADGSLAFSSLFEGSVVNTPFVINSADICVSRLIAITGNVHKVDESIGVEDVQLTINSDEFFTTDTTGDYSFGGLPEGNTFTITPSRTDDILNGVTTLDLVRSLQHILTASLLETPYQIIAADIDNSGSVNSLDLVFLQQAILQKRNNFPNNNSWRFVPEEFMFTDSTNPFIDDFPESLTLERQELDEANADFIAIKVGDVTLSIGNKSALKAATSIPISTKNKSFKKGEQVTLPFYVNQESTALGMQLGLTYNTEVLAFDGLNSNNILGLNQHNIAEKEGDIKMVWLNTNRMPITKTKSGHFQLVFTAQEDGEVADNFFLTNNDFKTELYKDASTRIEVVSMKLAFEEIKESLFTIEPVTTNQPVTNLMIGEAGACGDGIDNDGDGFIDCEDGDCFCECQDPPNAEDCLPICENFTLQNNAIEAVCGTDLTTVALSTTGGSGSITYTTARLDGDALLEGSFLNDVSAGTYFVTAHDAMGCTALDTFTIGSTSPNPTFVVTLTDTDLFVEDTSTNDPTDFAWTFGNFGTSNASSQGISIAGVTSSFDVCLTTSNNCGMGTSCQTIEIGVDEPMDMDTMMVDMDTMMVDMDTMMVDMDTMTNEQININAITRDADCEEDNGSIILTILGGVPPYAYEWSDPNLSGSFLSGLAEGTYDLTVTDTENNSGTSTIIINRETIIIDEGATIFIPDCNNDDAATGSIQLAALGGTPPYTYLLNDIESETGFYTDVPAGGFLLTIRDVNGCAAIYSLELPGVDVNPAFAFEEINNSIQFTDISNNNPISWSWTFGNIATSDLQNPQLSIDGITDPFEVCLTTNNQCGSAMVCQTVNGNSTVDTVTISPMDTMTVADLEVITTSTDVTCFGNDGTILVTPVGGTMPYNYTWSVPGLVGSDVSGLAVGNYIVTVSDAGGMQVATSIDLVMLEPVSLDLSISQIAASCSGGDMGTGSLQLVARGGVGPYTYNIDGQINETGNFTNLLPNTYSINISDSNGCSALSTIVVPAADVSPTFTFLEQETQIIFTDISTNNPTSWSWTFGNLATSNTPTQPLNIIGVNGPLEVCLTTENACGTGTSCQTLQIGNTPIDTMITDIDTLPVADLSITLNTTDINCQDLIGGTIEVITVGGRAPFTYDWNAPSIVGPIGTNLTAGGYSVTVTDALGTSVMGTTVIEVMESDIELDDSSVIIPSCAATSVGTGAFQLVARGGTAPYTFNLNNSISETGNYNGLFAGTYFLSIQDANGCTALDTLALPATDGTPVFIFEEMGNAIFFSDASTNNPTSWSWTFGNIATANTPTQALNIDGIEGPFEVCLTTTNDCGTTIFCDTLFIGSVMDTTGMDMDMDTTGMDMDMDTTGMGMDMDTTGMGMDMDTTGMGMDMDTTGMGMDMDTTIASTPTVNLSIESLTRVTSDTINLIISAVGFENILSYQYSIQLADSSNARIVSIDNFNLEGLSANNFFQVNDQSWTTVWFDPTSMGISVPDGTALFSVQMVRTDMEVDCIELEINGNLIPMQLIAAQGDQVVEGLLNVNNGSACTSEARSIFGTILRPTGVPVRDVTVAISNDTITATTGVDGFYSFNQIPIEEQIDIIPSRDGDYLRDVTTFDIVLMNRHILNITTLDSPYKLIAADVNRSNTITVFDLVLVQRTILGLNQDFPGNTSWRFVPASYEFIDPTNPFAEDFPEILTVDGFSGDIGNQDFIGIKIADVSFTTPGGSFTGSAKNRSAKNLNLAIINQNFELGSAIKIPVQVDNLTTYSGFQFALSFDPSTLHFEGLSTTNGIPLSTNNVSYQHIEKGKLLVSWIAGMEEVSSVDQLFELSFTAQQKGDLKNAFSLDNQFLQAESYTKDLQVGAINLSINEANSLELDKIRIYPNPSKGVFVIDIPAKRITPKEIIVYSLTGQQVYAMDGLDVAREQYTLDLSSQAEGTYIVMIKGEDRVEVQRVVVSQ